MKRPLLTSAAALLLAAAFVATPRAQAQSSISYTSGIQVQNLSGSQANIQIEFYDANSGNLISGATVSDQVLANSNKSYFPLPSSLGATFTGSAVVSSDQPVAAITNLLGNSGMYGGSATGLSAGSTTVNLPLVMRGNSGFNTFFSVQNTGTGDANVTITYKKGSVGNDGVTQTSLIKPGASKTFDQAGMTQLGTKFIGSATITSDQPVAAMVSQVGTGGINTLLMYSGLNSGSPTVSAPLIMANNSGYFSSINMQNVGATATTATITYSPNKGGTFQPANETVTLQPGEGAARLQAGGQFGANKYIGSATITASQPLVVVVNQLKIGTATTSQGTAYEGFNPATLTTKVSAPLLMSNNGGYFTSLQCQNAGGSTTTVTITYSPNTVGAGTPAPDTMTLAPGANATVFQAGNAKFAGRYIGAATISSSSEKIACITNQLNLTAAGDTFLTYDGINY